MKKSNFSVLNKEYPKLASIGQLAERNVFIDPSTSLSKLRLLVEKLTTYIIEFEHLHEIVHYSQNDRLNKLEFLRIIPYDVLRIFHKVRQTGNKATHTGEGSASEAKFTIRQTLKIIKWFYSVYEEKELQYVFINPQPDTTDSNKIKELESELEEALEDIEMFETKLAKLDQQTQEEIAKRKQKATDELAELAEDEAEARERIDLQLREVGWECDTDRYNYKTNKTRPEAGRNMAISEWKCGTLWADYALFIGTKLCGIVEAKNHISDGSKELSLAKKYSIEVDGDYDITFPNHQNSAKYRVPFIFASNGGQYIENQDAPSGIWFWDARNQLNKERELLNWFSPLELEEKFSFDEAPLKKKKQKSNHYQKNHLKKKVSKRSKSVTPKKTMPPKKADQVTQVEEKQTPVKQSVSVPKSNKGIINGLLSFFKK